MTSDKVAELRRLYYDATERTIRRDLQTAIEIFKTLRTEAQRERAAVYMDGLSQMRSEWARGASPRKRAAANEPKRRR